MKNFIRNLILFCIFFKTNNKNLNYLALSILSLYFIILVIIYLSTNFDLSWHLKSSANRVIKPLTLSFIVITLYNINLYKLKMISIIIPCYNEDVSLKKILTRIKSIKNLDKEIILVDDGSNLDTKKIINSCLEEKLIDKLVTLEKNNGKGFYLKNGIIELMVK